MEFNQKLQELRKKKGITQEELARELYVSRTAISKWESGRGYPNIESLKAIAKYFSITVDELLSTDEMLTIAEEDSKQKQTHYCDLVFGLLDLSMALMLFLPLFATRADGVIEESSLLTLGGVQPWLRISYFVVVIATVLTGIVTLALQNCQSAVWIKLRATLSLILSSASVLLFMVSLQPYAAILSFVLLAIKALMLIKRK